MSFLFIYYFKVRSKLRSNSFLNTYFVYVTDLDNNTMLCSQVEEKSKKSNLFTNTKK